MTKIILFFVLISYIKSFAKEKAEIVTSWIEENGVSSNPAESRGELLKINKISNFPINVDEFIKAINLNKDSIKGRFGLGMGESILVKWSDEVDIYISTSLNGGTVKINNKEYSMHGHVSQIVFVKSVPVKDVSAYLEKYFLMTAKFPDKK